MKCRHCGRELEPIILNDSIWQYWRREYESGMRFRHITEPTKSCIGGDNTNVATPPEAFNVSQILSHYGTC